MNNGCLLFNSFPHDSFLFFAAFLLTCFLTWLSPQCLAPPVLEVVADCIERSSSSGDHVDRAVMAAAEVSLLALK